MKEMIVSSGERIDLACRRLATEAPAFMVFNGTRVEAGAGDTPDDIAKRWSDRRQADEAGREVGSKAWYEARLREQHATNESAARRLIDADAAFVNSEARVAELEEKLLIAEMARDSARHAADYAWEKLIALRAAPATIANCGHCAVSGAALRADGTWRCAPCWAAEQPLISNRPRSSEAVAVPLGPPLRFSAPPGTFEEVEAQRANDATQPKENDDGSEEEGSGEGSNGSEGRSAVDGADDSRGRDLRGAGGALDGRSDRGGAAHYAVGGGERPGVTCPQEAMPRRPDLDEVLAYVERRERAAKGDAEEGDEGAHRVASAYALVADYIRNARFDVPRTDNALPTNPDVQFAEIREAFQKDADRDDLEALPALPSYAVAARVALRERRAAREELRFIVSYLGDQDQDANHAWMVRRIRAVLQGQPASSALPWQETDGKRKPRAETATSNDDGAS